MLPWLGVATVLALFELLTRTEVISSRHFPPPTDMFSALADEVTTTAFWTALGDTMQGWALGLLVAAAIAIPVGICVGSSSLLYRSVRAVIEFLRPIPSVALIPLVVLLFGSRPQSALILVVYAATWQVLVQVLYGAADVDPVARDTARSYRFSRWSVARTVIWPTALPYVVTGFRLAAAVALILEITAELVIGVPGLGRSIGVAQSSGAVPETYALVIVVGLIGVVVNVLARTVERRVLRWHASVRREEA
jgi:ABC-type nitrate/sulfonate/bicarbonate transport system permease component